MAIRGATTPTPLLFLFFNDTATTEIYTLSLHDALPLSQARTLLLDLLGGYSGTDADRAAFAVFVDVPRWGHSSHPGARRGARRARPRRTHPRPVRPRRRALAPSAPRCSSPAPGAARAPRRARAHRRLSRQRRCLKPRARPRRGTRDAPRAARRRLRRSAHPRAGRAAARLGCALLHRFRAATRRHVPLLLRERVDERDRERARRPPADEPPARAHRRLRGGRLDRPALLRRAPSRFALSGGSRGGGGT